eukprot:3990553-Alexandrium_andersonii.AAC.1
MNHPSFGRLHVAQIRRVDDKALEHRVPPTFRRAIQSGRLVLSGVQVPGSGRPALKVQTGVFGR